MVAEIQKIPDRFYKCPSHANGVNRDENIRFVTRCNRKNGLKKFEPFMLGLESTKVYSLKSFPIVKTKNGPFKFLLKENSYDSTSSLTDDEINNAKLRISPSLEKENIVPAKSNQFDAKTRTPKFITKYYHFINCQVEMIPKKDSIIDNDLKEVKSTKIASHLKVAIGLDGFKMIKYICESQDFEKCFRNMLPSACPDKTLNIIHKKVTLKEDSMQISTLQLFYDDKGNVCQLNVFHFNNENILTKMKQWLLDSLSDLYELCLRQYLNLASVDFDNTTHIKNGDNYTQLATMQKTNKVLQQFVSLHERIVNSESDRFFHEFELIASLIRKIYERTPYRESWICDSILFQISNILGNSSNQQNLNQCFISDLTTIHIP